MVIELLAETILPAIGRIIGYIAIEIIGRIFFYTTGYAFLKIITLGKKPKKYVAWYDTIDQQTEVTITGCCLWLASFLLLLVYFNV